MSGKHHSACLRGVMLVLSAFAAEAIADESRPVIVGPEEGERLTLGSGRSVLLKTTAEASGARSLVMGTESLAPGAATPVHAHDAYEKFIVIHDGETVIRLGDSQLRASRGTTLYVPAGAWHGVANAGPDFATLLFAFPGTDAAELLRGLGDAAPPDTSPSESGDIGQRHGYRTFGSDAAPGAMAQPGSAAAVTILEPLDGEHLRYPDGREVHLKVTAENVGAKSLLMGFESLPAGTGIPVHSHDGYEEVIFVHEGRPRLTLGELTHDAEPGTMMFVPAGTWHGVAGDHSNPSTILFTFPETEIAGFFRAVGQAEGEQPPRISGEDWQRIMKKHRMRARRD